MDMMGGVWRSVWRTCGGRARSSVGLLSVLSGVTLACPLAEAGAPGEHGAEVAQAAPLLSPRQQQQERRRWRQLLREQPLWTVAQARHGRGEAPQVISRLDDDPTQATQVRQQLSDGVTYTSTWLLGAFSMWSRLELPVMSAEEVDELVHDVQSALAVRGQRWRCESLSDGSLSYQAVDLSAAFHLRVTPAGVVIDSYDVVNDGDVVWRVVSDLFTPAGAWTVTQRSDEHSPSSTLGVGLPEAGEQSFAEGVRYRRDGGASSITMPSARAEHVEAVVAALMEAQAPEREWGIHPWPEGARVFYATLEGSEGARGDVSAADRHRLPFWLHHSGSEVQIWLSHATLFREPLWWHVVEHVAPTAPPTTSENGWLGDVTDDHRVAWSGREGRSCQSFAHGFELCDEVDQMTPHAMLLQELAFPPGQEDLSRAILSGLVAQTSDGTAWRPLGLTQELLSSCQVSVSSTGLDLYCSNGIETWLSGEPF